MAEFVEPDGRELGRGRGLPPGHDEPLPERRTLVEAVDDQPVLPGP